MNEFNFDDEIYIESYLYKPNFKMPNFHCHRHYEVFYLVSGKRKYMINDKLFEIIPGDLVLIKPGILHMTSPSNSDTYERILLNISENALNQFGDESKDFKDLFETNLIRVDSKYSNLFKYLLENINREYVNKDRFSNKLIINYIFEFLVSACRAKSNFNLAASSPILENETINRALQFIFSHYRENIKLDDLASLCHLNASYFSRLFKETTGITFIAYLNSIRIREATNLLLKTDKPVTEISYLCGFENTNHFSKVFKQIKGRSPGIYRKKFKITNKLN